MPVVSVTTQNQILNAWLGTTRAAGTPSSYNLELWNGDPRDIGSSQISGGGYAAQSISANAWAAAAGGEKAATTYTQFPTATGEYSDTATHYVLRDTTTSEVAFCAPLGEELDVTGPGPGPRVQPIVFFADPE